MMSSLGNERKTWAELGRQPLCTREASPALAVVLKAGLPAQATAVEREPQQDCAGVRARERAVTSEVPALGHMQNRGLVFLPPTDILVGLRVYLHHRCRRQISL